MTESQGSITKIAGWLITGTFFMLGVIAGGLLLRDSTDHDEVLRRLDALEAYVRHHDHVVQDQERVPPEDGEFYVR